MLTKERYGIIAAAAPDADPPTVWTKYLTWIARQQIKPGDLNAHLRSFARRELPNDEQLAKRKQADRAADAITMARIRSHGT